MRGVLALALLFAMPASVSAICGTISMPVFVRYERAAHVARLGPNAEVLQVLKGDADIWQNLYRVPPPPPPPPRRRGAPRVILLEVECPIGEEFPQDELNRGGLFFATADGKPVNPYAGSYGVRAGEDGLHADDLARLPGLLDRWARNESRRALLLELAGEGGWLGHEAFRQLADEPAMIASFTRADVHRMLSGATHTPIARPSRTSFMVFVRLHDPVALPWVRASVQAHFRDGYDVMRNDLSAELLGLPVDYDRWRESGIEQDLASALSQLPDRAAVLERFRRSMGLADLQPASLAELIQNGEHWEQVLAFDLCEQHHGRRLTANHWNDLTGPSAYFRLPEPPALARACRSGEPADRVEP